MKPTWFVQSNLISEDILSNIMDAAHKSGYGVMPIKIIPFSDSPEFAFDPLVDVPKDLLIPYGSTSMIKSFARSKWNKNGFFFNEANLRTSVWIKHLGQRILNHDSLFMTMEEAFSLKEGTYFMKPDNDLKDFVGDVIEACEIRRFCENVSAGGFCFKTDIPIVLSPVKQIGWEYRLFMIGTKVIAKSSRSLRALGSSSIDVSRRLYGGIQKRKSLP